MRIRSAEISGISTSQNIYIDKVVISLDKDAQAPCGCDGDNGQMLEMR